MGDSFSPLLGGCSKPPAMQVDFLLLELNDGLFEMLFLPL
jgi:hypothetical protein